MDAQEFEKLRTQYRKRLDALKEEKIRVEEQTKTLAAEIARLELEFRELEVEPSEEAVQAELARLESQRDAKQQEVDELLSQASSVEV